MNYVLGAATNLAAVAYLVWTVRRRRRMMLHGLIPYAPDGLQFADALGNIYRAFNPPWWRLDRWVGWWRRRRRHDATTGEVTMRAARSNVVAAVRVELVHRAPVVAHDKTRPWTPKFFHC